VDAEIRRIKETYRAVKAGLPWSLPKLLAKDLVALDDYDSDFEDDDDDEADETTGQPAPTRWSTRIAAGITPPDKLIIATKVREDKNEGTATAVKALLSQLFTEMEALTPAKNLKLDKCSIRQWQGSYTWWKSKQRYHHCC